MAGVKAFTCVGWQVTLCDPIWQVTLRSSVMGFQSIKSYTHLHLFTFLRALRWMETTLSFNHCMPVERCVQVFNMTALHCSNRG